MRDTSWKLCTIRPSYVWKWPLAMVMMWVMTWSVVKSDKSKWVQPRSKSKWARNWIWYFVVFCYEPMWPLLWCVCDVLVMTQSSLCYDWKLCWRRTIVAESFGYMVCTMFGVCCILSLKSLIDTLLEYDPNINKLFPQYAFQLTFWTGWS